MQTIRLGWMYSLGRLRRGSMLAALAAGLCLSVFIGLLERQGEPGAVDRSLTGAAFGMVLPIAVLLIVRRLCRSDNLTVSFRELAEHGASRRQLALGQAATATAASVAFGAIVGGATVLSARPWTDPVLMTDVWASSSVGTLAGATYACGFILAATFGKQGGGRMAFLMLDWLLGSTASALALPFPRGHVMNLLGGSAPVDLSQLGSASALVALTFLCLTLAISRIPR